MKSWTNLLILDAFVLLSCLFVQHFGYNRSIAQIIMTVYFQTLFLFALDTLLASITLYTSERDPSLMIIYYNIL